MNLFNLRSKFFRREVESRLYSGKKYQLPKLEKKVRENFPVQLARLKEEIVKINITHESPEFPEADAILGKSYGSYYHYNENLANLPPELGNKIAWKINLENLPNGFDPVAVWANGTLAYVFDLSILALYTGDEKYAGKAVKEILSFDEENPFCTGLNWLSVDFAAIRTVNLILSVVNLSGTTELSGSTERIYDIILAHSVWLDNMGEGTEELPANQGLVSLALLLCGIVFEESPYGKRLLFESLKRLERDIYGAFYADGTSKAHSTDRHILALEIYLTAALILRQHKAQLSEGYKKLLREACRTFQSYLRNDGTFPNLGDAFPVNLLNFLSPYNNINPTIVMALALGYFEDLNRVNLDLPSRLATDYFLGGQVLSRVAGRGQISSGDSLAYRSGGYFLIREAGINAFIKAGESLSKGAVSAAHGDLFGFELWYKDKPFIVDNGTYSYFFDKTLRDKLRTVLYHNTFYVDGGKLLEVAGSLGIRQDYTQPKILEWEDNSLETRLVCQHYAFVRLLDPVISKRTFQLDKQENKFWVKDEFYGGQPHKIVSHIHFHPDVQLKRESDRTYTAKNGNVQIRITFQSSFGGYALKQEDSFYSPRYLEKQNSQRLTFIFNEPLPVFYAIETQLL